MIVYIEDKWTKKTLRRLVERIIDAKPNEFLDYDGHPTCNRLKFKYGSGREVIEHLVEYISDVESDAQKFRLKHPNLKHYQRLVYGYKLKEFYILAIATIEPLNRTGSMSCCWTFCCNSENKWSSDEMPT